MTAAGDVQVLVVEDDLLCQRALAHRLEGRALPGVSRRCALRFFFNSEAALADLESTSGGLVDVVILDVKLSRGDSGLVALPRLRRVLGSAVPIVIFSILADSQSAVCALKSGANDFVAKDLGVEVLAARLADALRVRNDANDLLTHTGMAQVAVGWDGIIGEHPTMRTMYQKIEHAQRGLGNVLIVGESGTGKEAIAKALVPKGAPFVAVDAATLDGPLAQGELFGYEKGAFTGADQARRGLIEAAHGGILFLDELANMTLSTQAKLLRVVQEKEVRRLGATHTRPVKVRLVSATHADLAHEITQGHFRLDLLMRLGVFQIDVPPLRARLSDLPALFLHFLRKHAEGATPQVDPEVWRILSRQPWRGNVRQLDNVAQVVLAAQRGTRITADVLPAWLFENADAPSCENLRQKPEVACNTEQSLRLLMQEHERKVLGQAHSRHKGNISAMARALNIDRSSVYQKLRQYALLPPANKL